VRTFGSRRSLGQADALVGPDIGFRHPAGNVPFVLDGVLALLRFQGTPPLLPRPERSKSAPFMAARANNAAIEEGGGEGDRVTCGAGRLSSQKAQQSSSSVWSQGAAGGRGGEEGAAVVAEPGEVEERRRAA